MTTTPCAQPETSSFSIHIDCDNAWIYEQELALHLPFDADYLYVTALPRILDLLDNHQIKATFFIVGKDLALESCRGFCKQALDNGHMLANHSMTHAMHFGSMPPAEREAEIINCHREIERQTGFSCKGFRAPGYGMSEHDLTTLESLGYTYDSSSLPGIATLLIKLSTFTKSASYRKKSLNVWQNFWATSKATKVRKQLWRIPVATFPYLRLPVHASFAFMLGEKYVRLALWFLQRSKGHHIILLHGLDLVDSLPPASGGVSIPIIERPLDFRIKILNMICKSISTNTALTETIFK